MASRPLTQAEINAASAAKQKALAAQLGYMGNPAVAAQYQSDPKVQMANALLKSASDTSPAAGAGNAWMTGLARIGSGVLGGLKEKQLRDQYSALSGSSSDSLAAGRADYLKDQGYAPTGDPSTANDIAVNPAMMPAAQAASTPNVVSQASPVAPQAATPPPAPQAPPPSPAGAPSAFSPVAGVAQSLSGAPLAGGPSAPPIGAPPPNPMQAPPPVARGATPSAPSSTPVMGSGAGSAPIDMSKANFADFKDQIAAKEGPQALGGYNAQAYNTRKGNAAGLNRNTDFTGMTIGQVNDYQNNVMRPATKGFRGAGDVGSTGIGRYQFEAGTLADNAQRTFGDGWRDVPFTPQNQDRIAQTLFDRVKGNPALLKNTWAVFGNNQQGSYNMPDTGTNAPPTPYAVQPLPDQPAMPPEMMAREKYKSARLELAQKLLTGGYYGSNDLARSDVDPLFDQGLTEENTARASQYQAQHALDSERNQAALNLYNTEAGDLFKAPIEERQKYIDANIDQQKEYLANKYRIQQNLAMYGKDPNDPNSTIGPDTAALDQAIDLGVSTGKFGSLGGGRFGAIANQRMLDRMKERGIDPNVIAQAQVQMASDKAAGRTAATIGTKADFAANELATTIPLARQANASVPRGSFIPLNKLRLYSADQIASNPAWTDFIGKTNAVLNAYDLLGSRGGNDAAKRATNRKNLEEASSPAAYEAALKVMEQEIGAVKGASAQTRQDVVANAGGGGGPAMPPGATESKVLDGHTYYKINGKWHG